MAKDYAKKSTKTKSASRGKPTKKRTAAPASKNSSSLIIGGLIIVIIIAGLFLLKERHFEQLKHKMLAVLNNTKPEQKTAAANLAVEPKYDFYTILPKEKVWAPSDDDQTKTTSVTATTPAAPTAYIVQIGAFEKYDKADNLRARLTLEGYTVQVDAKPINGWTRVWLGPFKTLKEAQAMQAKIAQSDKLKGMIEPSQVS